MAYTTAGCHRPWEASVPTLLSLYIATTKTDISFPLLCSASNSFNTQKLDPMVIFGDKNDGETCVSRTEQCLYDYNIAKPFHRVLGTYAHRLQVTKKSREAPPGVMKWILPFLWWAVQLRN